MAQLTGLIINDTGSLTLPSGNTGQRPTTTATIQSFTATGTTSWTAPAGVTSVEVLVVAGGGGGGFDNGGGGGAGGVIYSPNFAVTSGTSYIVTVGAGGNGSVGANSPGSNGGNSVFASLTAIGGGGGGSDTAGTGANGGSGGGMGGYNETPSWPGGSPVQGQGHAGGSGRFSCGGGGAGGAGESGAGDNINFVSWFHGQGGPGLQFDTSGEPTWYAGGGGGGGAGSNIGGQGGLGGGGNGSDGATYNAQAGTANTGGGGGGGPGSTTPRTGANGGSGVVIIRYFKDSVNEDPLGQTRFNTSSSSIESFAQNKWKGNGLVTPGMQLYLDARNYTSGSTWLDLSGNGNNATLTGSPVKLSDNGGAIDFRTDDQSIETPLNPGSSNESFSYGGWFKLMAANETANKFAFSNYVGSSQSGFTAITTNNGGSETFLWLRASGSNPSIQTPRVKIEPYRWYYLFAVRDHANNKGLLYINGKLVSEATFPGNLQVRETSFIGGVKHGGGYVRSQIATMQVYNRALTADEVLQNYNYFKDRFEDTGTSLEPSTTNIFKPAIVRDNLTFHLDAADPSSFNPADRSRWRDIASGNHAALEGAPFYSPLNGGRLGFDGSADRGLFRNIFLGNGDRQWTVCAWMRTTTTTNTLGHGSILSNRSGGPVYSMLGVNSGRIVYWTYQSSAWSQKLGTYTVNDNNWHMLSWVNYADFSMNMYVDDKFDSKVANSTSGNNNPIDIVGASWTAYFSGDISVVLVYEDRALSHEEIQQNFEALRRRYGR
jgi:hypothetical protein